MSLGNVTNQDEFRDQEALQFHSLLDCAQNVLSGRGEIGALAGIADPVDRRRFASALWLEGADGASFEFWCHNLHNLLCDNGIEPAHVEIDGDSVCPCGHPLSHHAQQHRMGLAGVSRAWHLYTTSHHLDSQTRLYRIQASAQHPFLMDCVIQVAYSWADPSSRRNAAWQVLDAIDRRQPLIDALCRFFRVGPAAIRAMRQWRPSSRQYWVTYANVRRLASLLVELDYETHMELDARGHWRWVSVAHAIARSTGVKVEYLMRSECLDGIERLLSIKPARRKELLGKLRLAIRWLRSERKRNGGLPRPNRLFIAIGIPLAPKANLDYCFVLPRGWLAAPLKTPEAIRDEGNVMRHCIRRFTNDVMQGDAKAYSMRSGDGSERATLVSRSQIDFGSGEELHLTLAGQRNGSMSIDALEAMVALLRIVSPTAARMIL